MQGFSLIEVLVAVLILSLGLLGVASLQIVSLRSTQDAYYRSIATVQLTAMIERLRANQTQSARVTEQNIWNQINARLLPEGKGDFYCLQDNCTINIHWRDHGLHTMKMTAII